MPDYLSRAGLDEAQFRRNLRWQLGWQKYLDRYVTDENLKKYFEQHRADFDGRRVQVSQVLVKPSGKQVVHVRAAVKRAETIRRSIIDKSQTFEEAARKHSDAPSGESGGGIGHIQRHQPMPEPFSAAAFALKEGEISQPVVSPLGVHLILCTRIVPGSRTWQDAREELERSIAQYLFKWVRHSAASAVRNAFHGCRALSASRHRHRCPRVTIEVTRSRFAPPHLNL